MVLPFKGAQKHLQKGVCQNWTFTSERTDLKTLLEEMRLDLKKSQQYIEKKNESESRLLSNIERLMHELSGARAEISHLVSVNSSLMEQISVLKKHRYGSPSQRNRRCKDAGNKGESENTSQDRNEEKDGFDVSYHDSNLQKTGI